MAAITFKGNVVHTVGMLPTVGTPAPAFTLTKTDLTEISLADYQGKQIILNIFPSIDTAVCANSVRTFNKTASTLNNTVVFCISADLPFAQARFCGAEGLNNVVPVSTFRNPEFGDHYGVHLIEGALKGLLARAIVVINAQGQVSYTEQVAEITEEPNYVAVAAALAK